MSAFLIYRPVMDYEESMEAYAVCSTRKRADAIVAEIRAFMKALFESFPEYPEEPESEYDEMAKRKINEAYEDAWITVDEKRRALRDLAPWPYGLKELVQDTIGRDYDESSIAVMELPKL